MKKIQVNFESYLKLFFLLYVVGRDNTTLIAINFHFLKKNFLWIKKCKVFSDSKKVGK